MILYQECSSHFDSSKHIAVRGRGLFSLYIYIENFKNLLVRNHRTDFHIILQKCSFGDPLPRLFKPFGFVKKHGRQGWRGLFSLYIYIESLLVRNHQTDFNIILQKCSFGDPLPRLYICIENFKNLLVRNHWTDLVITWQKCFLGDPNKIVQVIVILHKTWPLRVWAYFPYISI